MFQQHYIYPSHLLLHSNHREVRAKKPQPKQRRENFRGNFFDSLTRRRSKMSWQSYIDDQLMYEVDGQHLKAAAIIGNDGSIWAQSTGFPQVFFFSLFWSMFCSQMAFILFSSFFFLVIICYSCSLFFYLLVVVDVMLWSSIRLHDILFRI